MRTVYLAGPIKGQTPEEATSWRQEAKDVLSSYDIEVLSPMRHKDFLASGQAISDHYEQPLSSRKGIVMRDRWDVSRCDLMLANLAGADRVSIGTVLEFGWANAFEVPIIAVMTEGDLHWHGMLTEIALVVPTLQEALQLVCQFLLPD